MTTLQFHTTVVSQRAKHNKGAYVAHIKHTLANPADPDVVLCLVIRRNISDTLSVGDLNALAAQSAAVVEPDLRDIAEDEGWLG